MPLGDYKVGDKGQGVADLQGYLREVGYDVAVDGVYGSQTRAAVIAFQKARRIRVDGIAGPETLIALSQARAEGWQVANGSVSVSTATPYTPRDETSAITSKPPSQPSKFTSLFLLVGLALAAWIFMRRDGDRE